MIILAFADVHGHNDAFLHVFSRESGADVVLLLGDITHFGGYGDAEKVVTAIERHGPAVLGVHGNCDGEGAHDYLRERGMSLHGSCAVHEGIAFLGAGYSLPCPGRTPGEVSDERFADYLSRACTNAPAAGPTVLVTHEPPYDTCADLAFTGEHVGSPVIRAFIEHRRPLICFCGHIHEGVGIDRIGDSLVVNPGPLRRGRYGWARIEGETVEADIRDW